MSERKQVNWRDPANGMTVKERLSAMAGAGYDVTVPMRELAMVCSFAAAAWRDDLIGEKEVERVRLCGELEAAQQRIAELTEELRVEREAAKRWSSDLDNGVELLKRAEAERDRLRAALLNAGAALGTGGCTAIKCDECDADADEARHSIYEGLGVAGYAELMTLLSGDAALAGEGGGE